MKEFNMKNKFFLILLSIVSLKLQGSDATASSTRTELLLHNAAKIITLCHSAPKDVCPQAQKVTLDERVLGTKFDEVYKKLQEALKAGATREKMLDILSTYTSREFSK